MVVAVTADGRCPVSHDHSPDLMVQFSQEFWDDRYRSAHQLWSGQPNPQLVTQAASLTPGDALDVGCGEGADAIWLARRGWTVTGVDISAVALERAAGHAAACGDGIARRISWRQADLLSWEPGPQRYDLVSAQFMYLPAADLESLHRRLAAAVRPGGTLLVVLHHPDSMHAGPGFHADAASHGAADSTESPDTPHGSGSGDGLLGTAAGRAVLALAAEPRRLAAILDASMFDVLVADAIARQMTHRDGLTATAIDTVLLAARRH
jgi:SAM-dependent methyltransferase